VKAPPDDGRLQQDIAAINRIEAVPLILEIACRSSGMGFAAVARVTEDRWIACSLRDEIAFGLQPGGELPVETTICDAIRRSGEEVVIDEVAADGAYCTHPTPAMYGFQSYISVPIMHGDGRFFGTLCAIDPRPARLKQTHVPGLFRLLAELIARHLDDQERIAATDTALDRQRQMAELQEQFVAVLGHDLRNPIASIGAGLRLLRADPPADKARSILELMQLSVTRMAELVSRMLDFAHERLGDGLPVTLQPDTGLEAALACVVAEHQSAAPGRTIEARLSVPGAIRCDSARLSQLLSNLLGNALAHGAPDRPVQIVAECRDRGFEIRVTNAGDPIPPEAAARLFRPYTRGEANQGGLGLGLYISAAIARAHRGTLSTTSASGTTSFIFRMPLV
jgi:signal transduction histidine kinase